MAAIPNLSGGARRTRLIAWVAGSEADAEASDSIDGVLEAKELGKLPVVS